MVVGGDDWWNPTKKFGKWAEWKVILTKHIVQIARFGWRKYNINIGLPLEHPHPELSNEASFDNVYCGFKIPFGSRGAPQKNYWGGSM